MLMWLCWQLKELADKRVNKKWLIRGGKEWAKLSYPTPLCSLVHPTGLPRPNQALAQISCRCTYRRQIKDKNWDGVVKHTGASIQEARGSMTSLIGRKLTLIVWRGFHNHWISYTILPCGRMVFWHISLTMEHWSHFGGFWWVHTLCDTLVMVFLFFISLINTRDSSFTTQWLMITLNNCFVCHRLAAPYPEKLQVTEAPQEQLLKMGLEKKRSVFFKGHEKWFDEKGGLPILSGGLAPQQQWRHAVHEDGNIMSLLSSTSLSPSFQPPVSSLSSPLYHW